MRGFKALESTAGNMKLIETLIAVNKFPNIFTGCKLSAIKVINCTTGEAVPPESLHQLMDNFNFLLDKTKDIIFNCLCFSITILPLQTMYLCLNCMKHKHYA